LVKALGMDDMSDSMLISGVKVTAAGAQKLGGGPHGDAPEVSQGVQQPDDEVDEQQHHPLKEGGQILRSDRPKKKLER